MKTAAISPNSSTPQLQPANFLKPLIVDDESQSGKRAGEVAQSLASLLLGGLCRGMPSACLSPRHDGSCSTAPAGAGGLERCGVLKTASGGHRDCGDGLRHGAVGVQAMKTAPTTT